MQGVILSTAEPSQANAAAPPRVAGRSYGVWAAAAIAALTVARLVWLGATTANLYPDEAQYWFWSLHPALGYYSKPPLVAWVIALTTRAFGDSEFAIRLAAPLLHAIAAAFVYGIAARLYNRRTGFWSALAYITLPGVSLSAFLISTDARAAAMLGGSTLRLHPGARAGRRAMVDCGRDYCGARPSGQICDGVLAPLGIRLCAAGARGAAAFAAVARRERSSRW